MSGDQEPWVFRGGLTADLQRLMPVDSGNDLFVYKLPEHPTANYYLLRPYQSSDESDVNRICTRTYLQWHSEPDDDEILMPAQLVDIVADVLVGAHLTLHPELCLVAYDKTDSIVGYACAALDINVFQRNTEICWLTELREKYPRDLLDIVANGSSNKSQKLIARIVESVHTKADEACPTEVYGSFPALISTATLREAEQHDNGITKRMLTVLLAALRANGCFGVHVRVPEQDREQLNFYTKIGFIEIYRNDGKNIYLGRRF